MVDAQNAPTESTINEHQLLNGAKSVSIDSNVLIPTLFGNFAVPFL
jgi:hypothetical protein